MTLPEQYINDLAEIQTVDVLVHDYAVATHLGITLGRVRFTLNRRKAVLTQQLGGVAR